MIEGRPNANFIQTLQGQVPGLNITTGSGQPGEDIANDYNYYRGDISGVTTATDSGQPGSNSTVILRGIGSINGNA